MFLRSIDTVALLFLILLFPIPFFWLLIHAVIGFWRRFGRRAFWVALPVWVVSGALLVVGRHRIFAERFHRPAWTWIAGAGLLFLGFWLERQTHQAFGLRRLVGLPELQPGHPSSGVVRSGVYRYLRHPRYLQYMSTLLAFAFLTGAAGYFLLAILSVLLYQVVARLEERELRALYGNAYEDYARHVPRFLPRLARKREPQTSP